MKEQTKDQLNTDIKRLLYFLHSFRPPRNTTNKWPERNIEGNNLLEVSDVDLLFKNMLLSPGESSVNV